VEAKKELFRFFFLVEELANWLGLKCRGGGGGPRGRSGSGHM